MPNEINWGQEALNAGNQALGGIFGLLLEKHNDRRQINQQQKLTNMQSAANKDLAKFTNDLQYQQWLRTNYPAQLEQIKKAGLSPGLMYGMGGSGGATMGGASAGTVSGGSAPQGGQEIMGIMSQRMQLELMKAQTENIQADTENKKAENPNIPLAGAETQARTGNLLQDTENKKAQQVGQETANRIALLVEKFTNDTLENNINKARIEMQKEDQEWQMLVRENALSQAQYNDKIKLLHAQAAGALLSNELIKAQTHKTTEEARLPDAQIKQIANDAIFKYLQLGIDQNTGMTLEQQKFELEKIIRDVPASVGLSADMLEKIILALGLKGLAGGQKNPEPAKYFRQNK